MQRFFSAVTEFHVFAHVDQGGSEANVLQELVVKIIPTEVCNRLGWYNGEVDKKTMICAGYEKGGRDSCNGDSGGPLGCVSPNGRVKLFGVVSWGDLHCAAAKKPGIYAKTAAVLGWIKSFVEGAHMHFCNYCLSSALHSSIGQNIKSHTVSGVRYPLSGVRSPDRV